MKLPNIMLTKK